MYPTGYPDEKKTLIKQGNPSDLGRFHLSLTDGPSIKCVIKKTFLLFISIQ